MERDILDVAPPSRSNLKSTKKKKKSQSKTARLANTHNQIVEKNNRTQPQSPEIKKGAELDVVPKIFTISIQTGDLIEHAIELWRMEQRLNKVAASLDESQRDFITNSIQKLKRYLEKNDVEIVDHTNQKFNYGRNLDVLLVEHSSDVTETIIKETKEPTILCKNRVVHKGKVIILERSNGSAKHG